MASVLATTGDDSAFVFFRGFAKDRAGLVFDERKRYFLEDRLRPLVKSLGVASMAELAAAVQKNPRGRLSIEVVEALTINETSFYRDNRPFEALRKFVLPRLIESRSTERTLNIWCAASSTGQEPYTLAMLLREGFPQLRGWRLRFVASDIDNQVLEKAKLGCYGQIEVNRGLPATLLVKYFQRSGINWQVRADLRAMIDFRLVNLVGNWPSFPEMDLILMRNVLIYFDGPTKERIMRKVHRLLRDDGILMLGSTEISLASNRDFERVEFERTGYYRKRR